jgi:hypothetical protein
MCGLQAAVQPSSKSFFSRFGLHTPSTIRIISTLSALFTIDAFAGGLVMQTFVTYWFALRWGMSEQWLGSILMGANVMAGRSALHSAALHCTLCMRSAQRV